MKHLLSLTLVLALCILSVNAQTSKTKKKTCQCGKHSIACAQPGEANAVQMRSGSGGIGFSLGTIQPNTNPVLRV